MLSSTEVTLSGSYTGTSSSPAELGFYWGTSSNSLTNKLTVSSVTATGTDSGTFEARLSDLVPGKSYVFQAFARVSGTGTYSSDGQVFYAGTPTVFKIRPLKKTLELKARENRVFEHDSSFFTFRLNNRFSESYFYR